MLKVLFFLIFTTLLFAQNPSLTHISLQLKWKNQFQFAGYYIAKEKGYYKDAGLDVSILEYQNGIDIVDDVIHQKDDILYGIGYPSVILRKANGSEIVLLSAINQLSPHVLLTLKSSNFKSIEDFKGKKIMISEDAIETASFIAMIRSHNLTIDDFITVKPSFNVDSLINKDVDMITAYISNETYHLEQEGIKFDIWNPSDYGFDFYDDILFTSKKELQTHPNRVEAFKRASLKGWKYAYENIDETVDLILKKYNTQHKTREALLYEAKALKKLAYFDNNKLGSIEKSKIKRIVDIYNILSLVHHKINIDDFIYISPKESVLSKVEKKYLEKKKIIKMCIDPNRMPYESFQNGKYVGITADFTNLISKKLNLNIELVKTKDWQESLDYIKARKCDILSLAMHTTKREKYLNFTSPYLNIPLVIATRNNASFINDLHSLKGKKLAITKGYSFKTMLEKEYPFLDIVEVDNIEDGLTSIANKEFYGYIGSLMSVSYAIQKSFINEVKISGKFENNWHLSVAVRADDPMLLHLMQTAVLSIGVNEKQKILNNWISINYTQETDYIMLFGILFFAIFIIGIISFLYKKEKSLKEQLEIQNIVFDEIINTIPNPIFYKDKSGVYRNANRAFSDNILGIGLEKLLGKKLNQLSYLLPNDEIEFYKKQDQKLYKHKENQVYETKVKTQDGTVRDFRIQKNLFYSKNKEVLGYVGFMYDITDIKEREKELEYIASTDPMTHLYNRRYFSNIGESLFKLAKRKKHSLSVIMFDIDNFKRVNDTYGHKIGDDVIIAIAKTLQMLSRESDIACRFGGEEFILLLPDTDIDGSITIATKIKDAISDIKIKIETSKTIQVTVSIGVASVDVENDKNLEVAIKRSDDALYRAKENGKNRVEVF